MELHFGENWNLNPKLTCFSQVIDDKNGKGRPSIFLCQHTGKREGWPYIDLLGSEGEETKVKHLSG